MLNVLVCGGRDFADRSGVFGALDRLHLERGVARIIAGGASGADTLAQQWAESRSIPVTVYPADWRQHGKAAGPIRNRQMLEEGRPDGVVAFPGGRGTADMVAQAKRAGLAVWRPVT